MSLAEFNNPDVEGWRLQTAKLVNTDCWINRDEVEPAISVKTSFYIKLAEESLPPRAFEESDASSYDSFHGRETDLCKDTSDTESYSSGDDDDIATMAVVEYELAPTSGSETELEGFSSSSSGAEDIIKIAAMAQAMYNESNEDSSNQDSEFSILADTEYSESPSDDPELGRADYWKCVKCNNQQNNPMYRYCEKCYQVRKNLFPPRPKKNRKTRSALKSSSTSSIITSPTRNHSNNQLNRRSISDITPRSNRNGNNNIESSSRNRRSHHEKSSSSLKHSAGESSQTDEEFDNTEIDCSDSSSSESKINFLRKSPKLKNLRNNRKRNKSTNFKDCSSSLVIQNMISKNDDVSSLVTIPFERTQMSMKLSVPLSSSAPSSSGIIGLTRVHQVELNEHLGVNSINQLKSSRANRKRNYSNCDNMFNELSKDKIQKLDSDLTCSVESNPYVNKTIDNLKNWDISNKTDYKTSPSTINLNTDGNTIAPDSGFSSCGSSQELSPIVSDLCSQETYCPELESQSSNILPESQDTVDGIFTSSSQDVASLKSTDSNLTTMSDDLHDNRGTLVMSRSSPSLSNCVENSTRYYTDTESYNSCKLRKVISDSGGSNATNIDGTFNSCMMCLTEPKNGVFVHNNVLHLCCCYKCAIKVWAKSKRCPVCNRKVKNVMKLYVH